MRQLLRRIRGFGPLLGDLVASAAACFVFTPGVCPAAMDEAESDAGSRSPVVDGSQRQWAGMDAALFLLVFITSEALTMILALRR
jgi:hypothetical protein